MPQATLKYDLSDPDDFIAHLRAIKSLDMALAIWDIVHNTKKNLHRTIGETDLSPDDVIDEVYKKIYEILEDHNIDSEELII
jgi:hypothetical protein